MTYTDPAATYQDAVKNWWETIFPTPTTPGELVPLRDHTEAQRLREDAVWEERKRQQAADYAAREAARARLMQPQPTRPPAYSPPASTPRFEDPEIWHYGTVNADGSITCDYCGRRVSSTDEACLAMPCTATAAVRPDRRRRP
jgi:hypothetical protein